MPEVFHSASGRVRAQRDECTFQVFAQKQGWLYFSLPLSQYLDFKYLTILVQRGSHFQWISKLSQSQFAGV